MANQAKLQRKNRALVTLLFIIVAAIVGWQLSGLSWVSEEVDEGYTDEAQRDRFLAARLFLEREGLSSQSSKGMAKLDDLPNPSNSTVVMLTTTRAIGDARMQGLWQWVEQGGHLITNVAGATDVTTGEISDPLLAKLGVEVYPVNDGVRVLDDDMPHWLMEMAFSGRGHSCRAEAEVFELSLDNGRAAQIALRPNLYMIDRSEAASASAANEYGLQLLQYPVGEGLVTITAGLSLWDNRQIDCYDHAYLLWYLTQGGEVWFLHHVDMPSLLGLMWQKAALAMVLLALLLALWLWSRSGRLGPLLPVDATQRRSLLEHLRASAMFAWRQGHIDDLIQALQQDIRQRMMFHCPGYKALNRDQQYQEIAKRAEITSDEVALWMSPADASLKKSQRLVSTVRGLQQIRNSI